RSRTTKAPFRRLYGTQKRRVHSQTVIDDSIARSSVVSQPTRRSGSNRPLKRQRRRKLLNIRRSARGTDAAPDAAREERTSWRSVRHGAPERRSSPPSLDHESTASVLALRFRCLDGVARGGQHFGARDIGTVGVRPAGYQVVFGFRGRPLWQPPRLAAFFRATVDVVATYESINCELARPSSSDRRVGA